MKHLVLIALAIVAACGKSKSKLDTAEDPGTDDCAAAVAKITELQVAANLDQVPAAEQAEFKTMLNRIGDAIAVSCRETKWPADVLACMKGVSSAEQIAPCQRKLSDEQNRAAEKAAQAAAAAAPAAPPSAAPAAPAPAAPAPKPASE